VHAVNPLGRGVFGGYGYLGSVSNNVAEFTAFAAACQWVAESDLPSATILGDSELVTDAFHGRKALHLPALRHLMAMAKAWLAQAGTVCVEHVPRRHNERADALANTAVDQQSSNMFLRDPLDWVVPPRCPPGWAYFESNDPALPPRMAGTRSITKALAEIEVPSAADLMLPGSENFVAGNLHRFAPLWARICSKSAVGEQVARWARDGVDVYDFFVPFAGNFNGREYRSRVPPRTRFRNHLLSPAHTSFVSSEIQRELRIGAIRRWGTVGDATPPRLVLPVGVEPSKPRKLNDGRFLNLWCKDSPFQFEGLHMLPALVDKGEYAYNVDDVSGYFHVSLTERSQEFFGFEWEGVYYVYTALNFGWKSAPYIYTCFSGEVAGFLRRLGLRYLFLLDDALGTAISRPGTRTGQPEPFASAGAAAFVAVSLKVALGYFVHPKKSVLIPRTLLVWLGLSADFLGAAFSVPSAKGDLIIELLGSVLKEEWVHFTTLESLVGKLGALALAAPGILIKLRRCYAALAGVPRSPSTVLRVAGPLRDELQELASMPFWQTAVAPWIRPVHLTIVVPSVTVPERANCRRCAPNTALVSYTFPGVAPGDFRVSIPELNVGRRPDAEHKELVGEIILLVAKEAIRRTGAADCFVTLGLQASWRPATVFGSDLSGGPRATARADALFACVSDAHLVLKVCTLPGDSRVAEWTAERANYRLCPPLWGVLDARLGPLQWDLMASDANAQTLTAEGDALPHYTRWPARSSSGTNVFSQTLTARPGLYANPVFSMMLQFLNLVRDQRAQVVLVAPGWDGSVPGGTWWPLLLEFATDRILLATKGTPGVFVQQTIAGGWEPAGPVPWDVWGVRFNGA